MNAILPKTPPPAAPPAVVPPPVNKSGNGNGEAAPKPDGQAGGQDAQADIGGQEAPKQDAPGVVEQPKPADAHPQTDNRYAGA
jgi:hypothetical protein